MTRAAYSGSSRPALLAALAGLHLFGLQLCGACGAREDRGAARVDAVVLRYWAALLDSYEAARAVAEELLEMGRDMGDPAIKSRALARLAYTEIYFGVWRNDWERKLERSRELCGPTHSVAAAEYHFFRGHIRGKWQSEIDEGRQDLVEAAYVAGEFAQDHLRALAYERAAELHAFKGQRLRAREMAFRGLALADHTGDLSVRIPCLLRVTLTLQMSPELEQVAASYAKELHSLGVETALTRSLLASQLSVDEQERRLRRQLKAIDALPNNAHTVSRKAHHLRMLGELFVKTGRVEAGMQAMLRARAIHKDNGNSIDLDRFDLEIAYLRSRLGRRVDDVDEIAQRVFQSGMLPANEYARLANVYDEFGQLAEAEEVRRMGEVRAAQEAIEATEQMQRMTFDALQMDLKRRGAREQMLAEQREFSRDRLVLFAAAAGAVLALMTWRYRVKHRSLKAFREEVRRREEEQRKNVELRVKLERAQRLETVGTLAVGVAHDFNNSLTAILGFAGLAEEDASNPLVLESIDGIRQAATAASSTTKSMMMLTPRLADEIEVIDLVACIQSSASFIRSALSKSIEIVEVLPSDLVWSRGDEGRLQQVLLNLAINARDAGAKQIVIELGVDDEAGEAKLRISDDGSGMTDEVLDRIFEPFFTTKERGQGTGLGMTVVHGVVASHGGAIEVDSQEGQGTTVRIKLPTAGARGTASASPPVSSASLAGRTVLCAEDNATVRKTVEQHLGRAGCKIVGCHDGEDVVARVAANPEGFDLLILDVDMPKMTGLEALAALRAQGIGLPAIVMSGLPVDPGHDATYLQKPFAAGDLLRLVRGLLPAETGVRS
ncbi:MAG: ATP-binding protein [Planctomycetota bacterium]